MGTQGRGVESEGKNIGGWKAVEKMLLGLEKGRTDITALSNETHVTE